MKRLVIVLPPLAFAVMAASAHAQSRSWVPWAEIGSGPAPKVAARAAAGGAPATGIAWMPSGQLPAPRAVSYPSELQGGPRPNISAQAPGQVPFSGFAAGSIVIDTAGRSLYFVTGSSSAYKYPISVGRDGFTWRGTQTVTSVQSWPDWRPPAEMRQRQPGLPVVMSGGINNPLGAKALYLGSTLYRIHGTNDSKSIGYAASSGCFRMMNAHVLHLATIAGVGTTVHVLNSLPRNVASGVAKKSG